MFGYSCCRLAGILCLKKVIDMSEGSRINIFSKSLFFLWDIVYRKMLIHAANGKCALYVYTALALSARNETLEFP